MRDSGPRLALRLAQAAWRAAHPACRSHASPRTAPFAMSSRPLATAPRPAADGGDIQTAEGPAIALLFAGQGAQTVGMTREQLAIPAVASMYEVASEVLGYDLKQIVIEGPEEDLNDTVHAQPALLIAGLAAVEKLRLEDPGALSRCSAVGGLSLGEYTALVHAGAMSFDDAVRVVGVRARAMQAAGKANAGTMATVVNLDDAALNAACADAAKSTGEPVSVANLLFPKGRVIGGSPNAVAAVIAAVRGRPRVIVKEQKVSGAFHTSLMASAQEPLTEALAAATIKMPDVPVVANTTGRPYASVDEIRAELAKQIVQPVQWEACVKEVIANHAQVLYDMGPRQTIKAMIRKVNPAVGKSTVSVDV